MGTYKNKIITANGKNYKLIDALGNGGNGAVWIAEDTETTQQYAVKFLNEQQSEKIARFEKEIAFCQQENHPNVVKIIGCGTLDNNKKNSLLDIIGLSEKKLRKVIVEKANPVDLLDYSNKLKQALEYLHSIHVDNGTKFYIMPLYQKTLRKVIDEETNPDILLDYWIKLAKAVEYIHSIDIYHRDIKPENIFVNKSGELVLADFGIAHFHESTMTKTSEWLGNKSYAAPEQLERENDNQVSAFSDIYALGKILNELFTKNNPSGLSYKLICDSYPQYWQLDMVVEKCLSQNPLERPSCKALLGEVAHIMDEVDSELKLIEDVLINDLEYEQVNESVMATARIAAKDIYWARYFLENASLQEISNRDKATDFSYHQNIHYALDDFIKSVYFQKRILNLCEKKFEYESNNYDRGIFYNSIDLSDKDNQKLYDTFYATVTKYHYPDYSLGKTLKYFLACCDYHCKEILKATTELDNELISLNDAPFFYLLYKLRDVFSTTEAKEYDIADRIFVNWERTYTKAYFS